MLEDLISANIGPAWAEILEGISQGQSLTLTKVDLTLLALVLIIKSQTREKSLLTCRLPLL